jgi:DNA-directed RNA polymerase subunit L/DNA-directed RNA polymerase alpha subunit
MAAASVFHTLTRVDRRTLSFTLSPTRYSYANTLRRIIQTDVKILGFRADILEDGSTSDVKVLKNTTPMSNEMLADRVGLLPIAMPQGLVDSWDTKSVLFKLHVKNETDDFRVVTASDFECLEEVSGSDERKRIPNTKFFKPNPITGETCMIAILKPMSDKEADEIHIEAYASLGTGRDHTRFNPTSQCSYSYTLDKDPARVLELFQNWLREQKKVDPVELEKMPERKAILEREFRSLEIYRCYKIGDDGEANSFDFTVESVGTLDTYVIITRAFSSLIALANKYASIDRGELPENIEIRPADARLKGFDFWIKGEDDTLGNMFQTWLDDNKVGRGQKDGGVTFAAYKVPHPLRDEMVFRIGVEDGKKESARLAFAEAAKGCADLFSKWASDFIALSADRLEELSEPISPKPIRGSQAGTVWQAHERIKMAGVKGVPGKK